MQTIRIGGALRRPSLRKMAIWTMLVLVLVSTLAVLPEDVEAQAPGNKDITFYFHNLTSAAQVGSISTMRIMNTTQGDTLNVSARSAKSVQYDFYLYPVLADDTTVSNNVSLHIWARRIATSGDNRGAAFIMRLYDVDPNGTEVATIASATVNYNMLTAWREYSIYATNVANYTVGTGHSLRVYVEIDGSSSNDYQMAWGDKTRKSRVVIEMSDYVRMNDVDTLDYERTPRFIFSLLPDNKTMIFLANITDPYGGYDIALVNATVVNPDGATILDKVPMTRTKGYFNSYYSEYEYEWNYSGRGTGMYNLTVEVVDWAGYYYRYPTNPGDATYGGHLESMTVSFLIGGWPNNVTINVTDDLDNDLPGATALMGSVRGTTNASGQVVLRLANGTYDLEVLYQGVRVYLGSHTVLNDTSIDVKVAVFSPSLVAVDDVGDPVFDAVVFALHPNGTFLDKSWRTDASGNFEWDTMAGGSYRISALWMGVEVFNSTVVIDGQGPFTIVLKVYQLDIQVVDSVGDGLELAQVVIVNSTNGLVADSKLTNFTGYTMSKVPIGSYDFRVYWRNELVMDSLRDHLVDASGTLVLTTRIFAVDLLVVDASDLPLTNARVVVGFAVSQQVQDFGTTDDAGVLKTRLPVGRYNFWVYWKDVLVNETLDFAYDGSSGHTIHAAVYWVDVHVQDTELVPVVSALVTLRHSDGLDFGTVSTDDGGNTSYRLPVGDYRIVVSWKDTVVLDRTQHIDSQDPMVLTAAIYYLRLHIVDSRASPVESALVATHNDTSGAIVGSTVTDANGDITHRVPLGNYRVQIVWQEAVVYEAYRLVDSNAPVTVVVSVYYVDIHVQDTMDASVEGALIRFLNATTGRSMGTQGTGTDGNVSYRTPIGDYTLRAFWQEALVHESLERVSSDKALTIIASIYYAFVQCVDTTGVPLSAATLTITNPVSGRIMGSRATDSNGEVTFRLPKDDYTFEVVWVETVVYRQVHTVDNNEPMVLVMSVYYAELHIVDSKDVPLENALVTFTNTTSGRQMGQRTTPSDGIVTFRLPLGESVVEVVWQEAVVFRAVRLLDSNDPWTIVTDVYYAELHVMDSTDKPLETALVTFVNAVTGRRMDERTTPNNGIVTFRLPLGEYNVTVVWQEAIVWRSVRTLDSNDPWTVRCNVYYGHLRIIDSRSEPVEAALVSLTNASSGRSMGDKNTGLDGVVIYRLPLGTYRVQVLWKDTNVYDADIRVDHNMPRDVIVDIFYPVFNVVDSREVPVTGALVTMAKTSNGRIMGSLLTDEAGMVGFRMPEDTYTVSVVWLDTLVHRLDFVIDSNEDYTIDARVFYVTFTAVDSRGIGLEWAQLGVTNSTTGRTMDSHTADPDGRTEFRLPIGVYLVEVMWQHAEVHHATWTVVGDAQWTIEAWVYYVMFHVTDGDGIDLAGAAVAVANETASTSLGPLRTDAGGNAEFRLPLGDVSMEVVWKSTVVYSRERLPVTKDATEEIEAWVYYITVQITDSKGVKLKGADVIVAQDGVAAESLPTPKNGTVVFRLPLGSYWVNMSYTTTYYLTPIDVSKSERVDLANSSTTVLFDLTKDDYPIPFYKTNLFWVILAIVLLVLLIVFLFMRLRKAPPVAKAEEAKQPAGEATPEDEGTDLDDLLEDLSSDTSRGEVASAAAAGVATGEAASPSGEDYEDDTDEPDESGEVAEDEGYEEDEPEDEDEG